MADVEAQMDNFLMIQEWDLGVLSFSYEAASPATVPTTTITVYKAFCAFHILAHVPSQSPSMYDEGTIIST